MSAEEEEPSCDERPGEPASGDEETPTCLQRLDLIGRWVPAVDFLPGDVDEQQRLL